MSERDQLEQAIAALDAQRAILGDAVVNAALAPMREKLASLQAKQPATGHQRKQVTVLFADVSGFTAMSETMDPEEVSETMNALWARLDAAITSHGGTIDKHIGDAIMALFGAPTAHEDDPERAIRAALDMQAELRAFAEAQRHPLRMRIGINTGPVLLGAVGTTAEYTAMGDTVNLASRLEHAAPVGSILISHDTYRHVRGVFDVQALEPITVKGKVEPIQVYVVRAAKPRAFRVPTRGVEGIETRTIGRKAELRRMQLALDAAIEECEAYVVTVIGEAGMGKSRLLYEFTNWLDLRPANQPVWLFKGRATQEMTRLPYALIRDMFAFRFDIQDSDRAAVARDKLEQGIVALMGQEGLEKAHFIGHLIGLDFSASPYLEGIRADTRQIRDRAFHYIAQFFMAITREHAAVILLEDIHWADDGALDLIDYLGRERHDLPLLIVGLTRPTLIERRPSWGAQMDTYIHIELHPLSQQDSGELVTEILRKLPQVPPTLQDLIVSRADGSPFYVEELIKVLIDDGVIVTGAERWHVRPERLAEIRVPPTLTGVLQARLDGLPPAERETLQQASVVGRVFWSNVLDYLQKASAPRGAAQPIATTEVLSALQHKELIFRRESSAFADAQEHIFKHAILRDVTYESVLKRQRRVYHAQVASWLIEQSGERVAEYAGVIGEHYERADEWARAADWYARAGKQAHDTYAPDVAISYFQKALAFWEEHPQSAPAARQIQAYDGLGEMLDYQSRHAEATASYKAMLALAEATGDMVAQARAWNGLFMAQDSQGDEQAALTSAARAEAVAQAAGAHVELAKALWRKGWVYYRLGDAEAALALGEQVLALGDTAEARAEIAPSLILTGAVNSMLGRYDQAVRSFEQALAICREIGDRRRETLVLNNLGEVARLRRDYGSAVAHYQAALATAREIGDRFGEILALSNLGGARAGLGEYEAAEADLRQVIEMAGATGWVNLSEAYRFLAKAYVEQSKIDEALEAGLRALALGQEVGVQEFIAAAWRTLGRIAARLPTPLVIGDQTYDATACFAESVRICTETGMQGERAHALRRWAAYEMEQGDYERGAAMWREARDIFARLGVSLEVERMAGLPHSAA
jgi:class 3 adenylate cyclase/predicted ATPase